jgi:hypothetical protein
MIGSSLAERLLHRNLAMIGLFPVKPLRQRRHNQKNRLESSGPLSKRGAAV